MCHVNRQCWASLTLDIYLVSFGFSPWYQGINGLLWLAGAGVVLRLSSNFVFFSKFLLAESWSLSATDKLSLVAPSGIQVFTYLSGFDSHGGHDQQNMHM
jgi:hypothetical protein